MTPQVPEPGRAAAPMRGWRLWLAVIVLLMITIVTVQAGRWQMSRAQEKAALAEAMAQAAALPLAVLTPEVASGDLVLWRPAVARGAWQPGYTVLLDNRNHEGAPGRWVATPLCLSPSPDAPPPAEGEAVDCDRAILVLRGWLARERPGTALAEPPAPQVAAPVEGRLLERVPRLFELSVLTGGEPASDLPPPEAAGSVSGPQGARAWAGTPPVVQNLALDALAAATGLPLLPVVLEQRNDTGDGLVRAWPEPSAGTDKHWGYALQWFAFAALALIALGVIVGRAIRNRR